jgi:hypothetical protein
MAAWSVRWRGSDLGLPEVSRLKRSSRRAAISAAGEDSHPGGRQLERQRYAIQAAADVAHGRGGVGVEHEGGLDGSGAVHEEPRRVGLGEPFRRCLLRARHAQRRHRQQGFPGHAQALPAGHQEPHPGRRPEHFAGDLGAGLDQVLTVVEHDQEFLRAQVIDELVHERPRDLPAHAERGAFPDPHGRRQRLRDQSGVGDGLKFGQPHAVGEGPDEGPRRLERQPGLAAAPGPGQGHQARSGQQRPGLTELGMPPHEAGYLGRQVAPGRRLGLRSRGQGISLEQDLLVKLLELGAGIYAQLIGQDPAAFLEDPERFPLAARPVQGQHQLTAQPLPERVAGHERLQLAGQLGVPAKRQLRFHLHLDGPDPRLLEACHLFPGEVFERELREHRATPQAERLPQQRRPARLIRGGGLPRLLDQPPEPAGIHLPGIDVEHVAGFAGDEALTWPAGAA